jgi:hypothetical protein
MATNSEIPTRSGRPFSERVSLLGTVYTIKFYWNTVSNCWAGDFYDEAGSTPILLGMPLVTGSDLLEQFGYIPLGANTIFTVMTTGPDKSPDTVPTFTNLGGEGHLYVSTPF